MVHDNDRSAIIHELANEITQRTDRDELIPFVVERLREMLPASGVSLLLLDEPCNELIFAYVSEGNAEAGQRLAGHRMPANQGVAGEVLRQRTPELIADAQNDQRHYYQVDRMTGTDTGSLLAVPLIAGERRLGVIEAVRRRGESHFTVADMAMLEQLSHTIAITLENAGRFGELKASAGKLRAQVADLLRELARHERFSEIITVSPAMTEMFHRMEAAAASSFSVLIQGETGAGKELVARAIHRTSDRGNGPFMALNCAAVPDGLMESVLFGHRKGSFTGALDDQQGLFRAASGGVLFLDEIGDMPLTMQAKLLRVIQDGEVTAVGETRPHKVEVRLISATNRDLQEAVKAHNFRPDLYYRLATFTIRVPPLRQRREDFPFLTALFLEQAAARHHKRIKGIEPEARELLTKAEWPGNVRQLQNEIEYAVAFARDGDTISIDHLSDELVESIERHPLPEQVPVMPHLPTQEISLADAAAACERKIIDERLSQYDYNISHTAISLRISRITLQKKMKLYGLRRP